MGIPALFRWLSSKYPKIVSDCIEEKGKNPNNTEFDNLYLDMNGIIHPCTHPENKPAPTNEEEMFHEIFLYIDRLFSVVRPRRLIYMAVDGVAPRAKMNQQRSRRFRAAKESKEKHLTMERIRAELLQKGAKLPDPKNPSEHFDSNCITPGTPFMARLATALQYYVYHKLNSDPGWKNIQVILSDASVPGEGEHKIMDYIRRQRNSPTHDPNTKHCLCGADADLIMLGLATHEPYFTIIREEFKPNQPRPCEMCGQIDHVMTKCTGLTSTEFNTGVNNEEAEVKLIFIHLSILREYLQQELVMTNLSIQYDFERAVDDWVFMCFFVGNDFLPHLPSLEIREKAIDKLIELYKKSVLKNNGWLTDSGRVNVARVQLIMNDLALLEDEIFKSRRESELDIRQQNKRNRERTKFQRFEVYSTNSVANKDSHFRSPKLNKIKQSNEDVKDEEDLKNEELDKRDEVKLWEEGYRSRYYQSKFDVSVDVNPEFCVNVAHEYLHGLCWVLSYYYQGCVSWTWYYPYHYAPFAVDFINLKDASIEFVKDTKPFNPLEQLMGVFPADSKSHVPPAWQHFMTDSDSPVIDFYEPNFKIDLNGKRYEWQGVALLPFVDEARLLSVLHSNYALLTDEEKQRNIIGPDQYFVRSDHPVAEIIKLLYESNEDEDSVIDPQLTNGVTGRIWKNKILYKPGDTVISPVQRFYDNISKVQVISCSFKDPQFSKNFIFPARLLEKVILPEPSIGPNAIKQDRKHFDTKPANRMIRHSLGGSKEPNSQFQDRNFSNSNNQFSKNSTENLHYQNCDNQVNRFGNQNINRSRYSDPNFYGRSIQNLPKYQENPNPYMNLPNSRGGRTNPNTNYSNSNYAQNVQYTNPPNSRGNRTGSHVNSYNSPGDRNDQTMNSQNSRGGRGNSNSNPHNSRGGRGSSNSSPYNSRGGQNNSYSNTQNFRGGRTY